MTPLVKMGATALLFAAHVALGASKKTEGPRLDSTKVTLAEYGTTLNDIYGTRRIDGCPLIWADDLREEKKQSKTKGGKYAEYKYYADFAVAIAGHEIEAVTRIWFDNHLVYDATGSGPLSPITQLFLELTGEGAVVKIQAGRNMRIYLGTEGQDPDPLIEAWYEDHDDFGADCTPAHRGTAYIVFQGIPVEKFGNRIPTVSVEAVRNKVDIYPSSEVVAEAPGLGGLSGFNFSPDFTKFFTMEGFATGTFEVWDVPTRTMLYSGELTGDIFSSEGIGLDNDGNIYAATAGPQILRYGPTGGTPSVIITTPTSNGGIFLLRDGAGQQYIGTIPWGSNETYFGSLNSSSLTQFDDAYSITFYCEDGHGDIWGLGRGAAGSTTIHFHRLVNHSGRDIDDHQTITVAATGSNAADCFAVHSREDGVFLVYWDGSKLYVVDDTTFAITHTEDFAGGGTRNQLRFSNHSPGKSTIWIGTSEVALATGEVVRTVDHGDWSDVTIPSGNHEIYDPINHALLAKSDVGVAWLYLDRLGSNGMALGSIIEAEANRVGVDIDASALDQTVAGYSVTQGPVRDRIAPLLDLHDCIIRPHGFDLQGLKQGTSSVAAIDVADFIRDGDEPRYEIEETQAADLPQRIEGRFADLTADQQTNVVIANRHVGTSDSARVQPIDLTTYVDTPDGMQQKAERFLRVQWNRRATVKNALSAKLLAIEVGDVYDLNLDGVEWTAYAEKLKFSATSPRIECEWRRTFPSLNDLGSGSGAGMDGREPDVIIVPGPTKGFVLDIPLVEDADSSSNPLLYYAAGSYGTNWPGAALLEGDLDGDEYVEWKGVPTSAKATWGFASSALGSVNPNLWDRGSVLTVNVYGTLTSSTEAAINADGRINLAALRNPATGDVELFNYATVTLTGTNGTANVYELTGLLRGRRGTEWTVGSHAIGDEFVLVSDLMIEAQGLSEVGTEMFFKAQSYGRDPDGTSVIEVDFAGNSLKPYAPVIHSVTKDAGTGDIEIVIRTRTRVGGAWNGSTIPTGETIAEYEFDVLDGDDVVRTLESTDKTFTYTAAQQTTDFGSELEADELEGYAYQLSATVGRGFARAA